MPACANRILVTLAGLTLSAMMAACGSAAVTPQPTLPPDRLWSPDPGAIVFRADISGGSLPELARLGETPACTIYGDNRIVWANPLDAVTTEVLFDFVDDAAIEAFINHLVIDEQFYETDARATQPPPGETAPVYETLRMDVGGRAHAADSFGGWDSGYFDRALDACRSISQSPIRFEPAEAWVAVRETELLPDAPFVAWNPAEHDGLSLASIAGGQRWVTGPAVTELWRMTHSLPYTAVFGENGRGYQVAVLAPGVTRDAPARPGA